MSIRLKRSLDYILQNYGHDILLQRRVSKGYSDTLERHTVRHWSPGSPTGTLDSAPEGIINDVDMIYAARIEMRPKERDRIYERDEGLGVQSVLLIDSVVPMRGAGGEIIYWLIGAVRDEPS